MSNILLVFIALVLILILISINPSITEYKDFFEEDKSFEEDNDNDE